MYAVFVVCIVIVIVVLLLAVITTSKAYSYKHSVDPLEDNPYAEKENKDEEEQNRP
ncbi:YtzI protein [Bacillus salipaludis]|uniref:YtzI protein n=1 Tax=Bacillus salipaludis TaxID=2547811 RepID=A0A4R5VTQ8_9BACI|nr:YtzI protein [Bacillus salipaludis]MDQ6600026.1 YtzI protein [Bacillus salipaludis]TDK61371.1 YtzI protein [Bacillus salipaludis]